MTNTDADTVSRINTGSRDAQPDVPVGGGPVGVAVGDGSVWVANGLDGTVSRIDAGVATLWRKRSTSATGLSVLPMASGKVWVAELGRRDGLGDGAGERKAAAAAPRCPGCHRRRRRLRAGLGRLAGDRHRRLARSRAPARSRTRSPSEAIRSRSRRRTGRSGLRTATTARFRRSRPGSPDKRKLRMSIHDVGRGPISIAAVNGDVWVAGGGDGTLSRIDSSHDQVAERVASRQPAPGARRHTRRPLRLQCARVAWNIAGARWRCRSRHPTIVDPALAYTAGRSEHAGDDELTASWAFAASAASRASSRCRTLPLHSRPPPTPAARTPSAVRPGMQYSTGEARASRPTSGRAVERLLQSRLGARQTGRYFRDIVGADRCTPGGPCNLSRGIVGGGREGTVTFHLTKPDGDFLSKLGLLSAAAVALGTPLPSSGADRGPGTGPYMIASYRKGHSFTLVRNPYFRQWSADAQPAGYPERITFSDSAGSESAVHSIETGKADIAPFWGCRGWQAQLAELTRDPSQVRLSPIPSTTGSSSTRRCRRSTTCECGGPSTTPSTGRRTKPCTAWALRRPARCCLRITRPTTRRACTARVVRPQWRGLGGWCVTQASAE